uniref:Acyl-CoA synthetases (AMP-forming)/AMP-acid ligases II n=1 Tax=uncultured beta proteobacterium HF0130_04F21 TaxID=710819 RepID=E0XST2_9PROT|nr:hypothetical protein [uncultured beta proteobacterium HF0130_04F21]
MRTENSWVRSLEAEKKLFDLRDNEVFAAVCGQQHSLYKYAEFRSKYVSAKFVNFDRKGKNSFKQFSVKNLIKNFQTCCPTVIYAIPNILLVVCKYVRQNGIGSFKDVRLILSGGESWIDGTEKIVKEVFPRSEIIEFYGSSELGFVGWGKPCFGFNLFPEVEAWADKNSLIWVKSPYLAEIKSPATAGDTGWFDKQGLLHLEGRIDRNFRMKGISVNPDKIEHLLKTIPKINHAYVFKNLINSKEKIVVIVCYSPLKNQSCNIKKENLKIRPLSSSQKIVINKLFYKKKITIGSSLVKSVKVWPLNETGKTNYKLLENLFFKSNKYQ